MDFDPDAYLATKAAPAFDPDAYLAVKNAPPALTPKPVSGAAALGRGAAQGATLGLGERIQGAIQAALPVPGDPSAYGERYQRQLKGAQAEDDKAKAAHPWLYTGGNIAGAAAPTVLLPAAKAAQGAGIAAKMGIGALNAAPVGAVMAGAESRDPTLTGKLEDAGLGAAGGALVGGAVPLLGKAISAAGQKMGKGADWAALRSSFVDRTGFRKVFGREPDPNDIHDLGQFVLKSGIPMHSPQAMVEGANGLLSASGQAIGDAAKQAAANGAQFDLQDAALKALQSPSVAKLAGDTEGRPLYNRILEFLDDKLKTSGNTLDPVEAHALRQRVDSFAGWEKDKPQDLMNAWRDVRGVLNDEMTNTMKRGGVGDEWAAANDAYSKASDIKSLAKVGAERRNANRFVSPYEMVTAAPAAAVAAMGHPAALAAPIAARVLNRYGMPVAARSLDLASSLAGKEAPKAATGATAALLPQTKGLLEKILQAKLGAGLPVAAAEGEQK